ncbi:EamA family transporter RarD [Halomonas binhaiensis]|uniref:EamA family transporter RarD n=1 Tax=Halomonas binhaiensis TaxID=2562282 RepID=A0A5C1NG91_9GAMM|nr:EamA family transporter RarD [Halomonas binhaiensis]QEM81653.1 EamA family transporter RarD [Halomonas binhaiensis]
MTQRSASRQGVMYGLLAYGMWGCFPLFFAMFDGVPALEILLHRILWSCLFLILVISVLQRWHHVMAAFAHSSGLWRVLGCAILIAVNWGLYIYAVETRHVLQASLGYFMTPLVNVALGMLVLKERINRFQLIAIALAGTAILLQLIQLGHLPWISLALAISFGVYGLLRKQVKLDGLSGLFVETLLLLPLAGIGLVWLSHQELSHFFSATHTSMLLIASGIITAVPLLAFAGAARRLPLGTLGFLMYINPTLQFLIAIWVFGEPLQIEQLTTFALIWVSLALYSLSSWKRPSRAAST